MALRLSDVLLASASGVVVTAAACPVLIAELRRRSIVDESGHRSSHTGTVPRGGGLAVILGTCIAGLLVRIDVLSNDALFWAIPCAVLLGIVGLVDDIRGLTPRGRLAWQVTLAGAFAFVSGIQPIAGLGAAGGVLALIWIVGFVNAFNFMDGINGISGGTALVILCSISVSSARWGSDVTALAAVCVLGAVAGFMPFNLGRARLFLGDVGSYFVGGCLALLTLVSLADGVPLLAVTLPFALYLGDVSWTLIRRLRRRESLLSPHREHVYQLLANNGWGHTHTAALVTSLTAFLAALGQVAGSLENSTAAIALAAGGVLVVPVYLHMPSNS